jgi:hypothetical protein
MALKGAADVRRIRSKEKGSVGAADERVGIERILYRGGRVGDSGVAGRDGVGMGALGEKLGGTDAFLEALTERIRAGESFGGLGAVVDIFRPPDGQLTDSEFAVAEIVVGRIDFGGARRGAGVLRRVARERVALAVRVVLERHPRLLAFLGDLELPLLLSPYKIKLHYPSRCVS